MSDDERTITVSPGAADLFDRCRKLIYAVNGNGGVSGMPGNTEVMMLVCTRMLEQAGVPWTER